MTLVRRHHVSLCVTTNGGSLTVLPGASLLLQTGCALFSILGIVFSIRPRQHTRRPCLSASMMGHRCMFQLYLLVF